MVMSDARSPRSEGGGHRWGRLPPGLQVGHVPTIRPAQTQSEREIERAFIKITWPLWTRVKHTPCWLVTLLATSDLLAWLRTLRYVLSVNHIESLGHKDAVWELDLDDTPPKINGSTLQFSLQIMMPVFETTYIHCQNCLQAWLKSCAVSSLLSILPTNRTIYHLFMTRIVQYDNDRSLYAYCWIRKLCHNLFLLSRNHETDRETAAERNFTPSSPHFFSGAVAPAMYAFHHMTTQNSRKLKIHGENAIV